MLPARQTRTEIRCGAPTGSPGLAGSSLADLGRGTRGCTQQMWPSQRRVNAGALLWVIVPVGPSTSRKLLSLAVPIIGINTLQVLMLVVDSALCGRLPNSEPVLAALGYAIQL